MQLSLFSVSKPEKRIFYGESSNEQVDTYPYPEPCPIKDECINYSHWLEYGTSCSGNVGFCLRAQIAAGRWMTESQWALLSDYTKQYLKRYGCQHGSA